MSILSFTIKRDFIRVWITSHPSRSLRWLHSYPHIHTIHKKKNRTAEAVAKRKIKTTIVNLLSKQWGTPYLTIGGVKSYNLDNLYNRKGADEHFKVFIGFENRVCTNLCVWSDGYVQDLKVKSMVDLCNAVFELLTKFQPKRQVDALHRLGEYTLQGEQFAKLIGRTRMYQYLPNAQRKGIPKFLFPDGHLNTVVKDYYNDQSFCRLDDGSISLWRLYNLFTGANKQSYIDTFLDRSQNAFDFVRNISYTLEDSSFNWFLQ